MSASKQEIFDLVIIGGGFYGCILALYLKKFFKKVILLEKEPDLLLKASYNNQARIHNGYHYPRSFITALRSHINYGIFVSDFKPAIFDNFTMVYAIAANNSKVTSRQFIKFCQQIGSPIKSAPEKIKGLFDNRLIEDVFVVEEAVFNSAKLREILKEKLHRLKIKVRYNTDVTRVSSKGQRVIIHFSNGIEIASKQVFNCTYSNINEILQNSRLPLLPLKHEFTEMPLLRMPDELKKVSITIMDGPFFSIMPFPDKKLHTLHHVRYTPLSSQLDTVGRNNQQALKQSSRQSSNAVFMLKDAQRYVPLLKNVNVKGSLYETKTLLILNEVSDARPILYKKDHGIKNFYVVMGGKIDNIYDIIEEIQNTQLKF